MICIVKKIMLKIMPILFSLLLLGCDDPDCDEACNKARKEFEFLANGVSLQAENKSNYSGYDVLYMYVNRAESGARVKYLPWSGFKTLSAELSEEEWLNLIRALYKCCIYEGEDIFSICNKSYDKSQGLLLSHNVNMSLSIDGYCADNLKSYESKNFEEAEKIIDELLGIIREKSEPPIDTKLKSEYQKMFSEPITDFELSTNKITFYDEKLDKDIKITRTKWGAVARTYGKKVELSIGEWLYFLRSLRKLRIDEWAKKYGDSEEYRYQWLLDIYSYYKIDFIKTEGFDIYPPNWDGFIKIMDDIEFKIEKDPSGKELENKLKSEYKKRFGEPISDSELFTRKVRFVPDPDKPNPGAILLTRTSTGAFAEYGKGIEAELEMDEWLDFIRSFRELRIDKWKNYYGSSDRERWSLRINEDWKENKKYSKYIRDISGNNVYPPNWDEFEKLMGGIVDKIRERNGAKVKAE